MPVSKPSRFRLSLGMLSAAVLLAACTRDLKAVLPTPAAQTATSTPAAGLEDVPVLTDAPTAIPFSLGLIAEDNRIATELMRAELQSMSEANRWQLWVGGRQDFDAVLGRGPRLMVLTGEGGSEALQRAIADHPDTQFVLVDLDPPEPSAANVIQLGGSDSRLDELGFLAGALAGWVTDTHVVGMIGDSATAIDLKYQNGFVHGVRYSCPACDIRLTQLPADAQPGEIENRASQLVSRGVDVFFAAPGPAGGALLQELAAQGVWVIGNGSELKQALSQPDSEAGTGRVLGAVLLRPDVLLHDLVPALAEGSRPSTSIPYALSSGSISLSALNPERVSPAVQARLTETILLLSSGALDTGIDPATGLAR